MPSFHLNPDSARAGALPSADPSVERTGTAGTGRQTSNALAHPWPLVVGLLLEAQEHPAHAVAHV